MSKAIVTGCAGFIGSALSRRLLQDGYTVVGIDCFLNNYDINMKKKNTASLHKYEKFSLHRMNLLEMEWDCLLQDADYVFHQAAVPGVRTSWGKSFSMYVNHNILATQKLLEAVKHSRIKKFIYASSSSIYGVTQGSTSENSLPRPISPYGVSKLAGEQLCTLYADNYEVPTVSLRYFTVYGPGQRPDMAFHKFIHAVHTDQPITIYGDGSQIRDFTFVDDVVEANILAMNYDKHGETFNIGGKSRIVLHEVVEMAAKLMNKQPNIVYVPMQAGDPPQTWADISKAQRELAYAPKTPLDVGLQLQIQYIKELYS